jgi:hypothetical protein
MGMGCDSRWERVFLFSFKHWFKDLFQERFNDTTDLAIPLERLL